MEYAYLVASLPTLTFGAEAPMTSAHFGAVCEGPLLPEHLADVRAILAGHPEQAEHPAARWYVARDTQLRSALARARAQRVGVDPQRYVRGFSGYDARTDEIVTQALNTANPLERALLIDQHRWWLLDQMVDAETFGVPAVFAYAFKLLLAERLQSLSESEGLAVADAIVQRNVAGPSA
jgi:hypothetical protein